jgi:hypothetical protein
MNIKYSISLISYGSWCGLGFIRGINSYKYNYIKCEKNTDYLYVNLTFHGFIGIAMYANLFFLPFSLYKELYRLEINVRNLENKKNSKFYNDLI